MEIFQITRCPGTDGLSNVLINAHGLSNVLILMDYPMSYYSWIIQCPNTHGLSNVILLMDYPIS